MNYKIFKTKNRDWYNLVRSLKLGSNYRFVKKIDKKLYDEILQKLKEHKTDGVLLRIDNKHKWIAGTIGLRNAFIPFQRICLTLFEREQIKKLGGEFI